MRIINIHEAKTHLSKLIDGAVQGESFIIAKAGRPLVKVTRVDAKPSKSRIGFMEGEFSVPENFDRLGSKQISKLFGAAD